MFCPNCKTIASEGAAFCPNCGTKLVAAPEAPVTTDDAANIQPTPAANEAAPAGFFVAAGNLTADVPAAESAQPVVEEAPAAEPAPVAEPEVSPAAETAPLAQPAVTPAAQQVTSAEPVVQTPAATFASVDFDPAPRGKKKKEKKPASKKKRIITAGIITALVATIAALVLIFRGPIVGFLVKVFGSPEDYLQHVEKQAIVETADKVSSYYGLLLQNGGNTSVKGTMKLKVSDKLSQLTAGSGLDLSFLNNSVISYETAMDGQLYMTKMSLAISKTDIIDVVMYMNMATGEYYLGLPSLSTQYLHYAPDYFMPANSSAAMMLYDPDFLNALPDEQTLNAMITKYLQLVIANVDGVDESSETLEIGDLKQKVTVLEYEISEKDAMKIVRAVLKEAKNDKDLKKIINKMAGYLQTQGLVSDAENAYSAFQEGIEYALDSMSEASPSSETLLVVTDYVDGASKVIGRKISMDNADVLEYVTITKGKKFATEWNFADGTVKLIGDGTISGDKREGEYVLISEGMEIFEIEVSYDEKKLEEGCLDGRFVLKPGSDLLNNMGPNATMVSSMNLGLELVINSNRETATMSINLVSGKEVLLGLTADSFVTEGTEISLPTDHTENSDRWASSLNWYKLIEAMEQANLPSSIMDSLSNALYGSFYY